MICANFHFCTAAKPLFFLLMQWWPLPREGTERMLQGQSQWVGWYPFSYGAPVSKTKCKRPRGAGLSQTRVKSLYPTRLLQWVSLPWAGHTTPSVKCIDRWLSVPGSALPSKMRSDILDCFNSKFLSYLFVLIPWSTRCYAYLLFIYS